ncbi:MAG: transcription termination factor NusA [Myxococcota bacterium]
MELDLKSVIEQVSKEKGLEKEAIIEILEEAMLTAARKKFGMQRDLEAHFNPETNEIELYEFREVVENPTEGDKPQMSLAEARKEDPDVEAGDTLGFKINANDLGRIAAQIAKQVIIQRLRDMEKENVYNEYKDRVGELVTGTIRRFEKGDIIVDLGRAEAVLPVEEQVPKENYRVGDRIQAYVVKVDLELKKAIVMLSRTHVGLIMKLFESEVPEISEGVVSIMQVAREPGSRTKLAVASRDSDVDPVGACVGIKGSRVQSVVQELRGEKIDIVPYSPEPAKFVCNALAPAEVSRVIIDESSRSMEIIVPDDQLSLAIGRKGQNVRLAAHLCGWQLDIYSETKMARIRKLAVASLSRIEGMTDAFAQLFFEEGYRSAADVAEAEPEDLLGVPTLELETAKKLIENAKIAAETEPEELLPPEAQDEAAATGQELADEAITHERLMGDAEAKVEVGGDEDEDEIEPEDDEEYEEGIDEEEVEDEGDNMEDDVDGERK